MSCAGRRCASDPALLGLWYRSAATAPIRPLAWEPPCAKDVALKRHKEKKKKGNLIQPELALLSREAIFKYSSLRHSLWSFIIKAKERKNHQHVDLGSWS